MPKNLVSKSCPNRPNFPNLPKISALIIIRYIYVFAVN